MKTITKIRLMGRAPAGSGSVSIALLSAAGFGAILFVFVAGFFLYANTQRLVAAKDWVEHTQEVLTSLQTASQQADRIEFNTRLYLLNKDEAQLSSARFNAISLKTSALHIHNLVADSAQQTRSSGDLLACSARLNDFLRGSAASIPIEDLLRCRETVSMMMEQERSYLKQRTRVSQHSSVVSLSTECAFVAFSLLTLTATFGILLRDAFKRRDAARQIAATNAHLAESLHTVEQRMHESRLLTSCRDELQLCTTVQDVYRVTAQSMARLVPGTSGCLGIINNSRNIVEVVSSWAGQKSGALPMIEAWAPDSCCGLRLGQLRWRKPGLSEIDCTHFPAAESPVRYLCLPMVAQSETLGVLTIECSEEAVCGTVEQHIDGLQQVLQLTGMAVASLHLRSKLENQSIRDALTGLFNRHFMQLTLTRELARAARSGGTVAVLMLDVDHFKHFNDTWGHMAGDNMLQAIAGVFRNGVRGEDTVCRYGGEEFAIILPGVTEEAILARAEHIRCAVNKLRVPLEDAPDGQATVSIGVALYPADAAGGESLLRKADQALYRAKHNGRNQVAMWQEAAATV